MLGEDGADVVAMGEDGGAVVGGVTVAVAVGGGGAMSVSGGMGAAGLLLLGATGDVRCGTDSLSDGTRPVGGTTGGGRLCPPLIVLVARGVPLRLGSCW
jgi:hypothetical protein